MTCALCRLLRHYSIFSFLGVNECRRKGIRARPFCQIWRQRGRGAQDRGRCKAGRGRRLQTFAADRIGLEIFADAAGRVALWRLIALQALAFGIATAPAGAFGLMLPSRPLLPA